MIDFSKIDLKSQRIFASFLGIGLIAICGSVGIALIKSSSFTYTNGQTNINFDTAKEVKNNSNDLEYANKKLREKLKTLESDIEAIKLHYKNNPEVEKVVNYVDESIKQLDSNAQEIDKTTEKLRKVAEEVESDR